MDRLQTILQRARESEGMCRCQANVPYQGAIQFCDFHSHAWEDMELLMAAAHLLLECKICEDHGGACASWCSDCHTQLEWEKRKQWVDGKLREEMPNAESSDRDKP